MFSKWEYPLNGQLDACMRESSESRVRSARYPTQVCSEFPAGRLEMVAAIRPMPAEALRGYQSAETAVRKAVADAIEAQRDAESDEHFSTLVAWVTIGIPRGYEIRVFSFSQRMEVTSVSDGGYHLTFKRDELKLLPEGLV